MAKKRLQEGKAAWASKTRAAERDLPPPPPIANLRRRNACKKSLRLFCETYNPEACYLGWSQDHLDAIARLEEAVLRGAMYAFAFPRGGGKTTLCRMTVLWAISYAFREYVFLIGANAQKAAESLDAIKTWIRYLPEYGKDFPEIAGYAVALGGIAIKAPGQTCNGESTLIRWEKERIVLPRVPKPRNLRCRGKWAPTSGIVIGVSGLTGDGIRGSLFGHPDGRLIRPDLVLLDDPQSDESAASLTQNDTREELVSGAVLGMAGPDKSISAVMPCTVIRRGDMADRILNRNEHPLWRGERRGILKSMPTNMPAWEKYFTVYAACVADEPPDLGPANEYYIANREALDDGAEASWPERKTPQEVSAIQSAMHLFFRRRRTFFAEYQNQPLEVESNAAITAEIVASKLNRLPRSVVPKQCEYIAAYIDVHKEILYWVVSAWEAKFGGGPIDYGVHPEQPSAYFSQSDPMLPLARVYPGMTEDAWLIASLSYLTDSLLARTFQREDGATMRIGKLLIDVKWGEKNTLLKTFCRRHPLANTIVHAAEGYGVRATSKPFNKYRDEPGALNGHNWRIPPAKGGDRYVLIDTNYWKSFAAGRLAMPVGTPGGWELFGSDPRAHQLFADHCVSEKPTEVSANGRTVTEWKLPPNHPDNHWLDCLCGTAVGGSMLGACSEGIEPNIKPQKRQSLAELAAKARKIA